MKQHSQVDRRVSKVPISDDIAAKKGNGYRGRCKPRERAMEMASAQYIDSGSLFILPWGEDQT